MGRRWRVLSCCLLPAQRKGRSLVSSDLPWEKLPHTCRTDIRHQHVVAQCSGIGSNLILAAEIYRENFPALCHDWKHCAPFFRSWSSPDHAGQTRQRPSYSDASRRGWHK
ncbi:hypothetical protein BU24DRAFT_250778 [Aaosphaeria arxii CBS 175.79]|uniref:Uncharacterized protein n=1 Tax=Aaosphaeria arxii CBS 175.79 TaxID=1450172 RepID=A0A6A5XL69_9PLEO|nr:uncharacterized protein BU24DRAFT_250778 [Aaosphaeria arxii CBS 175.79]KAF2014015.1 hypothetical protein BU24DRAFT_250778 [Aaosphaeria arxii CBS 175.79]